MAFPTSPNDGDVYGNHRWDATTGAWIRFPVASQAEAEAGTASNVEMTPLRTQENVSTHPEVDLNSTHRGSDGKDHSDVVLNNTHRGSDGKDHSDVVANNAKVTNATHTGEVTGSGALTIADNVVDEANLKLDTAPSDGKVLVAKAAAGGDMDWDDGTTLSLAADHTTKNVAYVPMLVFIATTDSDPTASSYPKGTLLIRYTA